MALGEPCTILPKDGRKVSKGRRRPLESAIDGELPRGIRDVVIAAGHMRDPHQMIVDDYGVIVSGIAVRPDEHRIADDLAWKAGRPVNQIVPGKGAFLNPGVPPPPSALPAAQPQAARESRSNNRRG